MKGYTFLADLDITRENVRIGTDTKGTVRDSKILDHISCPVVIHIDGGIFYHSACQKGFFGLKVMIHIAKIVKMVL